MKIIKQSYKILSYGDLSKIEISGRTCYQSQNKMTKDTSHKFVKMLREKDHHAMLEFGDITVKFITNRGVSHELVRHRMCSFAQESTRYVNYKGGMQFILPVWLSEELIGSYYTKNEIDPILVPSDPEHIFLSNLLLSELDYIWLLKEGWRPEQAREVLPNSLKTEIVVKANFREWRHIFKLRCSNKAHPQMRALMLPLLSELKTKIPVLFEDIHENLL